MTDPLTLEKTRHQEVQESKSNENMYLHNIHTLSIYFSHIFSNKLNINCLLKANNTVCLGSMKIRYQYRPGIL